MFCNLCTDHGLIGIQVRNSADEILDLCCEFFGIERKEIVGKSRYRKVMYARHLSMYLLHSDRNLYLTLSEIGRLFNGRDHSTVIHALKTMNNEFSLYDEIYEKAVDLFKHVYGSTEYFEIRRA